MTAYSMESDIEKMPKIKADLLPSNYKVVFVRLDKGYFKEDSFQYLEEEGIRYVAVSKNTQPLRRLCQKKCHETNV